MASESPSGLPHHGHVAVITGGVSGIGLAIARLLHAQGARIALWDRDQAGLDRAAPGLGGAEIVAVDITDADAVQRAADHTAATLGAGAASCFFSSKASDRRHSTNKSSEGSNSCSFRLRANSRCISKSLEHSVQPAV